MDNQTRRQIAASLNAAAAKLLEPQRQIISASPEVIEQGPTPLDYQTSADIRRLAVVDYDAPPPDPKDTSFAGGTQKTSRGKSKIKPAEPGTVAFIDYSLYDSGKRVFIHFMETRRDQRKKGYASQLLDRLYKDHHDKEEINWGRIMSDEAERLFMQYKSRGPGPETRGKL